MPSLPANIFLLFLIGLLTANGSSATRALRNVYGLYHADWDSEESAASLVISPDDRPLPHKANDPDAPIKSGFYLRNQRYPFAWSKLSDNRFSFKTSKIGGIHFSFEGTFKPENVDNIPNVPHLEGILAETQRDGKTQTRKIRFAHDVVL